MAGPVSLSLKDFSATAKASVTKALEAHATAFPKPDYRIGFIPPWWLGIIIINPTDKVTVADATLLAADIQRGVGGASAELRGAAAGAPSVLCGGGHIICGFIRPPDLSAIEG